jgi:hypothetical protein
MDMMQVKDQFRCGHGWSFEKGLPFRADSRHMTLLNGSEQAQTMVS